MEYESASEIGWRLRGELFVRYSAVFCAAMAVVFLVGCGGSGDSHKNAPFSSAFTSQVTSTNNPQVAQYSITVPQDATVHVAYSRDTSYSLNTWEVATPPGVETGSP